jgi:hypothetical protein
MATLQNTMLQFYTNASTNNTGGYYSSSSTSTSPRLGMMPPAPLSPNSLSHSTLHHQQRHDASDYNTGHYAYHPYPRSSAKMPASARDWDADFEANRPRKRSRSSRSPERERERPHPRSPSQRTREQHRPPFSGPLNDNILPPFAPRPGRIAPGSPAPPNASFPAVGPEDVWSSGTTARTSAERSTAPSAR